jgi:hypothetical protein
MDPEGFKGIRAVPFTEEQLARHMKRVEEEQVRRQFLDDEDEEYSPRVMEWLKKSPYYKDK